MHTHAIVLQPCLKSELREDSGVRSPDARLDETVGLAEAISLDIVSRRAVIIPRPRPATLFGTGVVEEIAELVKAQEAGLVVVGGVLSPVQQRNLERAWKTKVIDRTSLILEIFGERARTREGQLQVELAALTYQRSRLVRSWTHLERQRGGFGFVGGPGESQIEIDRRLIDERISRLKRQLEQVKRTRGLHRRARQRVPYPVVALVGYTNAGKSTLFNRMTRAEVYAEDMLFATLDPTMRQLELPSGRIVILSDTVGFVSELPHDLVAAFRATLEEVLSADVVVHVRDVSHPESDAQKADVDAILKDLLPGEDETDDAQSSKKRQPVVEVLNKLDLLDAESRDVLRNRAAREPDLLAVSALTGEGIDGLLNRLDALIAADDTITDVEIPISDGATLAWLYRKGDVISREDSEATTRLRVRLRPEDLERFRRTQSGDDPRDRDPA